MRSLFTILLLFVAALVGTEHQTPCDIEHLYHLLSLEVDSFEKREKTIYGFSAEGAHVEYYYHDALRAIKAIYYSETGQTTLEYYLLDPKNYAARYTNSYYLRPIYSEHFALASNNRSEFIVCQGKLVPGLFADTIISVHYETVRDTLGALLKASTLEDEVIDRTDLE